MQELEHAWITAASVLRGRELVLDVSGLTGTDENGTNLLSRMRESGVRLEAEAPPEAPGRWRWLGLGQTRRWSLWTLQVVRLIAQRIRRRKAPTAGPCLPPNALN